MSKFILNVILFRDNSSYQDTEKTRIATLIGVSTFRKQYLPRLRTSLIDVRSTHLPCYRLTGFSIKQKFHFIRAKIIVLETMILIWVQSIGTISRIKHSRRKIPVFCSAASASSKSELHSISFISHYISHIFPSGPFFEKATPCSGKSLCFQSRKRVDDFGINNQELIIVSRLVPFGIIC